MNVQQRSWVRWITTALAVCLGIFVWEALSDEPPATDRPHKIPVAIIDIAKVFKDHREFNEKMLVIKGQIEAFEKEVRARAAEVEALRPKEPGAAPPSEEDIAKAAKLQEMITADVAAHRQAFLADEARIYFEIYTAIEKTVQQVSRDRDIGVVFRFSSEFMNPGDRASVLQGVNRSVVYSDVPDLTRDVLAVANGTK
jgi:hypothetical protein